LLEQKQTAVFITRKIYRFFVNENLDEEKVSRLSDRFYKNGYDIQKLLDDIFTSDWFYEEKNIGNRIKSPVELIAGIQRMLPMDIGNEESLIILQRLLGQVLFYPPTVAGWNGGKSWIDSSSLMLRLRIPLLINDTDEMNVSPKIDDDQAMGMSDTMTAIKNLSSKKSAGKVIQASIEWKDYTGFFAKTPREKLVNQVAGILLQTHTAIAPELINHYADASDRESFIKSVTLQLMSTPEYQLC